MEWTEQLNRSPGGIALGKGTVELLNWAHQQYLPDNRPHRHTFFEACQVGEHGEGLFYVEERAHRLTPGTVFIARPGIVHQIVNTASPEMELFWVCFQWTPGADGRDGELDHLVRSFAASAIVTDEDDGGRLAAQWQALRALAALGPLPGYEFQASALMASLLLTIVQIGAGSAAGRQAVSPDYAASGLAARLAVRYIHDNLNRPLSAVEIAGHVCVSARHLSRLFHHFTGTSPAAYIVHARMDLAKGLLVHSAQPIKEIAAAVGYPDVHHFSRVFAQQAGCPPGEYRRSSASRNVPNIQNHGDLV
jgi:AraC family L-rhamnose operon transcriptional activator RhaR